MPIKLISGAGGSLTVTPASTASNYTLTVPAVTANVITSGDVGTITGTMISDNTLSPSKLTQQLTANGSVTASSGSPTSVSFHAIPSWAKRISIGFHAISTNSTGFHIIQFGTGTSASPSWLTSTYTTEFGGGAYAAGFKLNTGGASSNFSGMAMFMLLDSSGGYYTWSGGAWISDNTAATGTYYTAGSFALSAPLTQARVYTSNGTDTFDAGYVNLFYE